MDSFAPWDDELLERESAPRTLGVAQFLARVKGELSRRWSAVRIEGEIRSIKTYPSGHVYFDVRDPGEEAVLSCVMFRRDAARLRFAPKAGDRVELFGGLNIYEARGQLNFIVREMTPAGAGALYAKFLELKERLAREGVFDEGVKRPRPAYPAVVGVITSTEGAALHDVLRTLKNTAPWVDVVVYPTSVQGALCETDVLAALDAADSHGAADVILLVRGGGSLADLWGFNSEAIARRLRAMTIPVIAGIGHESDFTIADMASDLRAATPTAAAAAAVAVWSEAPARLAHLERRCRLSLDARLALFRARLPDAARLSAALKSLMRHCEVRLAGADGLSRAFEARMNHLERRLDDSDSRLAAAGRQCWVQASAKWADLAARLRATRPEAAAKQADVRRLAELLKKLAAGDVALRRERVNGLKKRLSALNVESVLKRGFSYATDREGRLVRSADCLAQGDVLDVRFEKGAARTEVRETQARGGRLPSGKR